MKNFLALDAMGEAHTPSATVFGAYKAWKEGYVGPYTFFGNASTLEPILQKTPHTFRTCVDVCHTNDNITHDLKGVHALRGYKKSSLYQSVLSVQQKKAWGVVSSGNTGAYMVFAMKLLGCLSCMKRPAMAALVPTLKGSSVMLDLGASFERDPQHFGAMALIGSVMAEHLLGIKTPRVGLLNVGSEHTKGPDDLQRIHQAFEHQSLFLYQGFVEGDSVSQGVVDVVVTDGFTGNIALKTGEGVLHLIRGLIQTQASSCVGKLCAPFAYPFIRFIKKRLDPERYNGALIAGLTALAIKSHGSSGATGVSEAIKRAYLLHNNRMLDVLCERFQHFSLS